MNFPPGITREHSLRDLGFEWVCRNTPGLRWLGAILNVRAGHKYAGGRFWSYLWINLARRHPWGYRAQWWFRDHHWYGARKVRVRVVDLTAEQLDHAAREAFSEAARRAELFRLQEKKLKCLRSKPSRNS